MRHAVMGSMATGALVALLAKLAWTRGKDLHATLALWPTAEPRPRGVPTGRPHPTKVG
jgi:hypothetical protein